MADQLRSILSDEESPLNVANDSSEEVDLLWLDFDGKEQSYGTIASGESSSVSSYVTHPWIIRGLDSGRIMCMLVVAPGGQSIAVKDF